MRVRHLSRDLGLASPLTAGALATSGGLPDRPLDGDGQAPILVEGSPDRTHAAGTDLLFQPVPPGDQLAHPQLAPPPRRRIPVIRPSPFGRTLTQRA